MDLINFDLHIKKGENLTKKELKQRLVQMDVELDMSDYQKEYYVKLYDAALKIPDNINKLRDKLIQDTEEEKKELAKKKNNKAEDLKKINKAGLDIAVPEKKGKEEPNDHNASIPIKIISNGVNHANTRGQAQKNDIKKNDMNTRSSLPEKEKTQNRKTDSADKAESEKLKNSYYKAINQTNRSDSDRDNRNNLENQITTRGANNNNNFIKSTDIKEEEKPIPVNKGKSAYNPNVIPLELKNPFLINLKDNKIVPNNNSISKLFF
jgi:hypothetical protein